MFLSCRFQAVVGDLDGGHCVQLLNIWPTRWCGIAQVIPRNALAAGPNRIVSMFNLLVCCFGNSHFMLKSASMSHGTATGRMLPQGGADHKYLLLHTAASHWQITSKTQLGLNQQSHKPLATSHTIAVDRQDAKWHRNMSYRGACMGCFS